MVKEKLVEILEEAHDKCSNDNGYLKNLSFEELERMNETFTIMCDYCPPTDNSQNRCKREICGATEEVLYLHYCPDCNKCGKWSYNEDEIRKCIEEEYGYY